jgi:hypothetical protein
MLDLWNTSDIEMAKESIWINRDEIEKYQLEIKNLESRIVSDSLKKSQLKDLKKLSKKLINHVKDDKVSYETKTILYRLLIEKIVLDEEIVEIIMIVPDNLKRDK